MIGLPNTFLAAAAVGIVLTVFARYAGSKRSPRSHCPPAEPGQEPEAPAAELVALLRNAHGRVMETVHYRVSPEQRTEFLK